MAFWLALGLTAAFAPVTAAAPYIWDEDGDHIDDRVETVHALGYEFSFELNDDGRPDTLLRQRIAVLQTVTGLFYSVYVIYDHTPTAVDFASLATLGMPVLHRYEAAPAVRSVASFAQVELLAPMPGVERIEAVPVIHPMLQEATGAISLRDHSGHVFPTWESDGGGAGEGIVVAFLDSGINDQADGGYDGHESLAGRCLGGASFTHGDSTLDTGRDESENPTDHGGAITQSHGTHVASIAVGGGSPEGFARGMAPSAYFIDVKVLNDLGVGTGVAEALDWCISNRDRNWSGPAGYEGIDVVNLSLSSVDQSDGNDLAARLADQAAALGIVVVASMGNDAQSWHVPSPAGGDRVLAIGALDHQRTPLSGDDRFASFSNYGPRANDGDMNAVDEGKPDLLAPGVAVLAADGDLSTDGHQYKRMSGTSMAAAFASGAAAALLSSYPTLDPGTLGELLRATAVREMADVPAGQSGADPRWYSPIGYGAIDLYAARLEMEQPARSQVTRLDLTGEGSEIGAVLRTQREFGPVTFTIERAPDENGWAGTFSPYETVVGTGDPSLADANNRGAYARTWNVPAKERGARFWYRVTYTQDGNDYTTPHKVFASPTGPSVATLEITIVHNAYDNDVVGEIEVGSNLGGLARNGGDAIASPALVIPLPATSGAASNEWVTGTSTAGNVAWTFHVPVPPGPAEQCLPPTTSCPWRLDVSEGGFINRSGRITQFDLVWHTPQGDVRYEGEPVPQQTIEGQTAVASIPQGVLSVNPSPARPAAFFAPNPVRAGGMVTLSSPSRPNGTLGIFDLHGREIGRATFEPWEGAYRARWEARGPDGRPLAPGMYFAGQAGKPLARLVVIR